MMMMMMIIIIINIIIIGSNHSGTSEFNIRIDRFHVTSSLSKI